MRFGAAVALAGLVATVVTVFAPSGRSNKAEAHSDTTTTSTLHATDATASTSRARVAVFGDSLTVQAGEALVALGRAHGLAVSVTAYYGLAPCDYASLIRDAIAKRPDTLVLDFSGNNLTPCMLVNGHPLTGAAYYARYRRDVGALVALASARGIPVELVAPPVFPPERDIPKRAQLIVEYAKIAFGRPGVALVQTAPALGGPGYLTSLPCLPGETAAMGCHNGRIVVRNASRIHFDDPRTVPSAIPTDHCSYSSGAHRDAAAIVAGLARFGSLGYQAAPPTAGMPLDDTQNG